MYFEWAPRRAGGGAWEETWNFGMILRLFHVSRISGIYGRGSALIIVSGWVAI